MGGRPRLDPPPFRGRAPNVTVMDGGDCACAVLLLGAVHAIVFESRRLGIEKAEEEAPRRELEVAPRITFQPAADSSCRIGNVIVSPDPSARDPLEFALVLP